MLPRKLSCLLNAAVVTFLVSGSNTTLAGVNDGGTQITEAQKAADKAKEDRLAEMRAAIAARKGAESNPDPKASSEPEKKPADTSKSIPMPTTPHAAGAPKPRTLQEQIALNKQKKAEELKKNQEVNKAAGGAAKPMTWQERARLARETRLAKEAAMKPKPEAKEPVKTAVKDAAMEAKPEVKDGLEAHTKPPVKEETPAKVGDKPAVAAEKEATAGDEPMKRATNISAPPRRGPRPPAMSPTQRRLMAAQEKTPEVKAVESTEKPIVEEEKPLAMSSKQRKIMTDQEKADSAGKPTGASDVFAELLKKRPRVD